MLSRLEKKNGAMKTGGSLKRSPFNENSTSCRGKGNKCLKQNSGSTDVIFYPQIIFTGPTALKTT